MIYDPDVLILSLMLIAAGLCGFALAGAAYSERRALRGIGWFITGLLSGGLMTVVFIATTEYY